MIHKEWLICSRRLLIGSKIVGLTIEKMIQIIMKKIKILKDWKDFELININNILCILESFQGFFYVSFSNPLDTRFEVEIVC